MSEQAATVRLRGQARPAARVASPSADVEVVETLADFHALKQDWNELAERSATPQQVFQDFGFLKQWADHYLDDGTSLAVLVVRRAGRVAAIAPFTRQRWLGFSALRFMGAPVARFNDVLADPDADDVAETMRSAIRLLRADFIDAPLVRDDSAFMKLGLDRGAVVTADMQAPYSLVADRAADDGPGEAYPAKKRSDYRRRVRKLAGDGTLEMKQYPPGAEAAALASEAIRMKRAWLEREGIAAPTVFDPRFEACFAGLAGETSGLSSLWVSTLERDGRAVGIDLSFDFKGHSFGHVIATSVCSEKDGAGSVLVHHVFATAKSRGNRVFELLTPADEHKMRHADGVVGVRDLAIPLTWRGQIACRTLLAHALPAAKAFARRLPPGLARALAAKSGY